MLVTWTTNGAEQTGTVDGLDTDRAVFRLYPNPDPGPAWRLDTTAPASDDDEETPEEPRDEPPLRHNDADYLRVIAEDKARDFLLRQPAPDPVTTIKIFDKVLADHVDNGGYGDADYLLQHLSDLAASALARIRQEEEAERRQVLPHYGPDGELYGPDGRPL
ncbi:hypothetical protein OHA25_59945 (plasmid) [Nonomuraea sp. NBC_00507]|uniref:hypothetical protein n=1 Tax=Nonomuraea sp. NBC_00507 TaxID=2976002 RepID=UPI002E171B31